MPARAALFTDGRYTTQAQQQLDPTLWELRHIIEQPAVDWLKEHAAGRRIERVDLLVKLEEETGYRQKLRDTLLDRLRAEAGYSINQENLHLVDTKGGLDD